MSLDGSFQIIKRKETAKLTNDAPTRNFGQIFNILPTGEPNTECSAEQILLYLRSYNKMLL